MKAVSHVAGVQKLDHQRHAAADNSVDIPQFGEKIPDLNYPVRRGAHGVARDSNGLIAIVCIGSGKGVPEYDLPGGGVDEGEAEADAMIREFMEETGLPVKAGELIARAGQYWRKDNVTPRNSQFAIFEAFVQGPAGAPSEPHHFLLWMTPEEAMGKVRHRAHAWAIERYLGLSVV